MKERRTRNEVRCYVRYVVTEATSRPVADNDDDDGPTKRHFLSRYRLSLASVATLLDIAVLHRGRPTLCRMHLPPKVTR